MSTVTSVNDFLQALVAKRLYEELASGDLLWHVVGYLGGFENKLRSGQTYWGVPLMEDASGGAESLKLAIPKYVMDRAGAKAGDYVSATGTLRVSKQFRSSAFEVYLSVTELRLLDAPATVNERRQETSTLQMLKSVAANRNRFPERTTPTIAVIHSRSQEAQVYADFCQPLRAFDSTLSLQPIPANMLSGPELAHAIRTVNADIIALIRGGGSDEQFSVFENPDLLRAWSEKRAYRVAGIGHSGNSTALDLLSDFAATTPTAAGTHIADALRTRRDSQQHVADLRAQNDELRMQLRQVQMQHVAQPPARSEEAAHSQTQHGPSKLSVVVALLIGILAGMILLLWYMHRR